MHSATVTVIGVIGQKPDERKSDPYDCIHVLFLGEAKKGDYPLLCNKVVVTYNALISM